MKITILSWWAHKLFDPAEPQPFGGAELQLSLLAEDLVNRHGAEVHFITRGRGDETTFMHKGVRVQKLALTENPLLRRWHIIRDTLRALRQSSADVFLQRGGGIETGLTARAAHQCGAPFVFMTSHLWDVDGTHARQRGWLYGTVYRYGLRRASAIITQSDDQREALLHTEHRDSTVLRSMHRIPERIPSQKKGVLFISRCEPWKNPQAIIDIARALPGIPVTLVSPPANDAALFESISHQARSLAHVRFMDGTSFAETESLFASHRVFVNTSDSEGFPNTFVQACKWGTPIVSLHVNPDGLLDEHGAGVCTGGDVQQAISAIQHFLQDAEDWQRTSEQARSYATTHHDISHIASRVYRILSEAAK